MTDPKPSDRRRAPRRKVSEPLMIVVEGDRSQVTSGAFAVDLSDLGARVRAEVRLEAGQLITVIPRGGPPEGIPSQVVWVSEGSAESEAGLAFLQPLSAGV